jgi:hypothetical protein
MRRKPAFVYPIAPVPRTAVLVPGFRSRGPIRVFREGWGERARQFAPQAIAATIEQIEVLAANTELFVTHALVVITREQNALLTDEDRDRLWRGFGVPVFEQLVSAGNAVLASECEAHDGLHVIAEELLDGSRPVERSRCACGRDSPRIGAIDPIRRVAAYAR